MANALTLHFHPADRWFEGNAWCFGCTDGDGKVVVRIDDEDWKHLCDKAASWQVSEERETGAISLLARIAAKLPFVTLADGLRRIDVMLR